MAKNNARDNERRAIAEQLRKEQARKERMRSLLILGACVLVVIGLLVAALIPYLSKQQADKKVAATPLTQVGVASSAASCDPPVKRSARGSGQHLPIGTKIPYPDAPPAFGPHWPNFLSGPEIRTLYTPADRPPLERLVHSLEHGHTLLWYDDTITPGSAPYTAIQAVADKLGTSSYFMAVPWTKADGKPFPSGRHIALTHWTGPQRQQGVTQYCGGVSGAVVKSFLDAYPPMDAPEPGST